MTVSPSGPSTSSPSHPDTRGSWRNLARTYEKQRRLDDAEELWREMVRACERRFGDEAEVTQRARAELESFLAEHR